MSVVGRFSKLLLLTVIVVAGYSLPSVVMAGDENGELGVDFYMTQSCGQLWHERNSIYAQYGYCFTTSRGIAAFGSECHAPYGKLPNFKKDLADHIKSIENAKGC